MRFSLKSLSTARHSKTTRLQRGFTLIELVIVLAVLGALAAIAVPQLTGLQEEAELAGTAAVVSSELNNAFAQQLANGTVEEDGEFNTDNASTLCGNFDGTSTAPALSGFSLSEANGESIVTVTVPAFVSNQVESVVCELTAN